jgi:hypothetical protein
VADLPIGSDEGAGVVEIIQSSTQNKLAVASNGSLQTFADNTGTGTIAALNGAVVATTHGCGSANFNVTGTWVATLTFQGTTDGTNWFTVYGVVIGTDVTTQFISTNVPITIPCGGLSQVRLIATAYTSGTANVAWNAGAGTKEAIVLSPVAASFNATVIQSSGADLHVDIDNFPATQPISGTVASTAANLWVTATGAAAAAVTLSLPAVAAQFHYIGSIEIEAYSSAARTGGVTPVLVTTTNLSGSPVWTFATAAAIGTTDSKVFVFSLPIHSSTVNTATTIVCPATTGIIWRVNVGYYTGA